jgi:hypothetical protein
VLHGPVLSRFAYCLHQPLGSGEGEWRSGRAKVRKN